MHKVWLLRSAYHYRTDLLCSQSYAHFHLLAKIKKLYDCTSLILAANHDIFSYPYEGCQDQSIAALHALYTWAKHIVN